MEVDKSMKLVFNQFQNAITEVPLEVYYQTITSDQYSSSGFQFNIKQPGTNALLDCDIWVKYTFNVISTNDFIPDMFETTGAVVAAVPPRLQSSDVPFSSNRMALRGGNCVARCIQNLSVQINNTTLNVQPYKYMDVLNRIYVSNDQSEHEFSASGGRFDEGNHGILTAHTYGVTTDTNYANGGVANEARALFQVGVPPGVADANNTRWYTTVYKGFNTIVQPVNSVYNRDIFMHVHDQYPVFYEWYNPGFSKRFDQFSLNCRTNYSNAVPNAAAGRYFVGNGYGIRPAGESYYVITIYERLPIPIFKMYSTDGTYGVIPNIKQMQIQGNFVTNFFENFMRCSLNANGCYVDWNLTNDNSGELYLRWFTPPVNMQIPRELDIPYPKINTWSTSQTIPNMNADLGANQFLAVTLSSYNITLEAIPDLLLIYVKFAPFNYSHDTPDDCLMELVNLTINIDNASGKLNQIQSLDLYQKWKKIIKHQDSKIIGYNEWRKYCCVACLQPEDYGCRYGPGYSNQTTLGITATIRDWHVNPSVKMVGYETMGGDAGLGTTGELFVTSIYNKNRLTIRADGTASQSLTKIAADFNMLAPQGAIPPASI